MKLKLFLEFIQDFEINQNKYFFEVTDPEEGKKGGYGISFGIENPNDPLKFNLTSRHEQFRVFGEIKNRFTQWINEVNPDKFYFTAPDRKRMRIYLKLIESVVGDSYYYKITDYTEYGVPDLYYVAYTKNKNV